MESQSKDENEPPPERTTSESSAQPSDDDESSQQAMFMCMPNHSRFLKSVENKTNKQFKFKCKFSGTVCDVMTRRGWIEEEDEYSLDWDIFWCDVKFITTNTKLQDHQRISHFRSCFEISRKNLMVKNLKRLQLRVRKAFGKEEGDKMNFFPTTYILPTDHKFFLQNFRKHPGTYWIIKPAAGAQGRGIFIFSELSEYNEWRKYYHETLRQLQHIQNSQNCTISPECFVAPYVALSATQLYEKESGKMKSKSDSEEDDDDEDDDESECEEDITTDQVSDECNTTNNDVDTSSEQVSLKVEHDGWENNDAEANSRSQQLEKDKASSCAPEIPPKSVGRTDIFVLQRYIEDPYLIGGRKFDLRIFVLVTSYQPLKAWLYRDGFARFCSEPFSLSDTQNMYIHLTNAAVQRTSENYDEDMDLKWSLKKLRSFFLSRHGRHEVCVLMSRMDTIVVRTLQSILHVVVPDRNSFELYGFDIMVDRNMNPWLLEVNVSPAFTPSSGEDYHLKCCLIDDTVSILDLEKRRIGTEKQVGSYDLFWDNGPIYADPTCSHGSPTDCSYNKPKLNTFLGCKSDRETNLREMYKRARNYKKGKQILEKEQREMVEKLFMSKP